MYFMGYIATQNVDNELLLVDNELYKFLFKLLFLIALKREIE